ncbi:MAG: hypothetical protein LBG52_01260 [Candidatus Peribacteria bacterium]|nr:hypothetical protein [Candidatus Peribacteria bacterium]
MIVCLVSGCKQSETKETIMDGHVLPGDTIVDSHVLPRDTIIDGVSIRLTSTGWFRNDIGSNDHVLMSYVSHSDTVSHVRWEKFWEENSFHLEIVGVDYNPIGDAVYYRER